MPPITTAYEVVLVDPQGRILARTCRRSTQEQAQADATFLNHGKGYSVNRWFAAAIEERSLRV